MASFLGGLPNGTAFAWEIFNYIRQNSGGPNTDPRVDLYVPTLAWAFSLRDDLRVFTPELEIYILPALETNLLKNRGPSLQRRMLRSEFFSYAQTPTDGKARVFIYTAEALAQRIPDLGLWNKSILSLRLGDALDRDTLAQRLMNLGYLVSELVERPAEYALRGSIVDFYSSLNSYPIRVELFGDEVQSLRSFHPDSQRRIHDLSEVRIPPVREFFFSESKESQRQMFRKYFDDRDWSKSDRDGFLSRLEQEAYFPTIDYWAPMLSPERYEHAALPLPKSCVLIEPQLFQAEFRSSHKESEKNLIVAREEQEWVPEPADFLAPLEGGEPYLKSLLENSEALWLSSKQLTGHPQEPTEKKVSHISTHDRLSRQLTDDRLAQVESPFQALSAHLEAQGASGVKTLFCGQTPAQLDRLNFLLTPYGYDFSYEPSFANILASPKEVLGHVGIPNDGFFDADRKFSLILDEQVFGTKRKRVAQSKISSDLKSFSDQLLLLDLKSGDLVVHKENGIGRFLGLRTLSLNGIPSELLEIEYRDSTKLLVPVTRLDLVQKYTGGGADVPLDKLGGSTWETKKSRAKKTLQSIAGDLLHLYSLRQMAKGPEMRPPQDKLDAFAASFAFTETPDQLKAIENTIKDLEGPRPMDRLICGDVGYGKTEVAIRAAYAAAELGYQVAVLAPTTILAAQHESNFKKRFKEFGISVEGLSRFKSARDAKLIIERVKSGEIRIVIGTHKLLGNEVSFRNLGLMVIDEEQRFGVVHKEKLRRLRSNVHILSMTATPIPRTLNMALSGIKDLSIITTAPRDRLSVRTHVARKKESLIQEAIQSELKRGGQVFYVHNRVQTLPRESEMIRRIAPAGATIDAVHGQMDETAIEEKMLAFYEGRTQVLLTTSIIESGLDVPNANTLIVDRADMFGLAQLYQIRGRVGRSNQRAYAYFLLPERGEITQDAEERLAVLEAYQELGSGFHIASHDLEIRGSGDLLGREQSGQISALGFETYVQLLNECVAEIKGHEVEAKIEPEINLQINTLIPSHYIPEAGLRMIFYRKLAAAASEAEIYEIEFEMRDRFGEPEESVENLIAMMRLKSQLRRLGIRSLTGGKAGFALSFDSNTPVQPAKLVKAVSRYPAHFQMNPGGKLVIKKLAEAKTAQETLRGVETALSEIESWCL